MAASQSVHLASPNSPTWSRHLLNSADLHPILKETNYAEEIDNHQICDESLVVYLNLYVFAFCFPDCDLEPTHTHKHTRNRMHKWLVCYYSYHGRRTQRRRRHRIISLSLQMGNEKEGRSFQTSYFPLPSQLLLHPDGGKVILKQPQNLMLQERSNTTYF